MLNKTVIKLAIPVAVGALALTGCGGGDSGSGDTVKIAFEGPLSGDNVALGENMQNGVQLAIKQANASGDLGFKLEYVAADDQGLPDKAPTAAQKVIDDPDVKAVVGPAFSGPTNTASPSYAEAGLVTVTPSATNPLLTDEANGFTSLLRAVPNDNMQGKAMGDFFSKKIGAKKVYLIDDKTDYGVGLSKVAEATLKAAGVSVVKKSVPQKTPDYSATAKDVVNSKADGLIYAGYYQDLAPFAKKLSDAGFKGAAISGDGSNDAKFVELAGSASENWYLTCPCTDATVEAGTKKFAEDYQKEFNRAPGTYSAEAYDVANMIIAEIKKAGKDVEREALRDALAKASYKGLTKTFSFEKNGEFKGTDVFVYQVKSGKIAYQGNVNELIG
ncbi:MULTISPECIES: branched-chain amino acid ABC transporter substrate-binding protein [unclassified Streptomyces]|uniref:branched-chain amino acid ABC transporter substrate-binding protein n=1 Tax=unclassified Streptomyces TaxID=2593676 RepID=UPI0023650645|nr:MULTISPECIES: branched-chain amino acid ABC transporter substrate-binding protein [unclassified Streptomyces]MDF3141522.1 branched-chain amino acid ABC transporter substrate-binding protein [Streptomyces sp. T21Q-yed]WDF37349.1 branched-chain amino acid ABC transporter substrate-binding protein [Streptomyces sp. T12]